MEELEKDLENIAKANQSILDMEIIDYDFVNGVRKYMYDTALAYLRLKDKTLLIGKLFLKKITKEEIIQIVERSLIQLRFDLKSEVDIKLLKFITPD